MLHPNEQFEKLGSVGRECVGSRPIRLLDPAGNDVPDGETGELYSCNPHTFDGYWKLPDKTADAFRGSYCTVGDLARRDEDGYIFLVDRKSNMIISGGENVYPSEVEALLGVHPKVRDVAVIGVADQKWGERVHAVIVLQDGEQPTAEEIPRLVQDTDRGLQASAVALVRPRRRYAANRNRQDFASGAADAAWRRLMWRRPLGCEESDERQDLNVDELSCAGWIARFLKTRGVDRVFGLQGGHIQPIWDHVARQGIRIIDVRDEGAAVHMAHAHAELMGGFGVAMVTAGPGVTNTVTAMANASLARAPVLLIGGCTSRPQANMGPLQDIPHVDIIKAGDARCTHLARARPGYS